MVSWMRINIDNKTNYKVIDKKSQDEWNNDRNDTVGEKIVRPSFNSVSGVGRYSEDVIPVKVEVLEEPVIPSNGLENPLSTSTTFGLFRTATSVIYVIAYALTVLFIMIGGFMVITSSGSPEQIIRGKKSGITEVSQNGWPRQRTINGKFMFTPVIQKETIWRGQCPLCERCCHWHLFLKIGLSKESRQLVTQNNDNDQRRGFSRPLDLFVSWPRCQWRIRI